MCVNFLKENYISVFFVVKLFLYICLDKIEYFFNYNGKCGFYIL